MNVEHGTFTPFVFSLTDGEGPETSIFQKIVNKTEEKCEKVQTLTRWKLSFLILKSVLLGIRGSRSIIQDPVVLVDVFLKGAAAVILIIFIFLKCSYRLV